MYRLTEEGRNYLEKGLPERRLVEIVGKEAPVEEVREKIENFDIAVNWAKKRGWIEIKNGKIIVKSRGVVPEEKALRLLAEGKSVEEDVLRVLMKRKLVEKVKEDIVERAKKQLKGEVTSLTPELIKTGLWRDARFKRYDPEKKGKVVHPGKRHILSYFTEKIRRIFLDLGFEERKGPFVESSFWNFDALYQPQDHPARDLADTFYMSVPKRTSLPERKIVEAVKRMHEKGDSESSGWGYKWSEDFARRAVLRTHTTAVSARSLVGITPPAKVFTIDRVFRNETIDYSHLPEFTQVEGIVIDESVTFRDLLGYLKEFYQRLGFERVRFRPAYFPYTEMSVEPEVYFEEKGEWLELGGAGIFRPEVTRPLGVDVPVLAWGLGLERPIMLALGLKDLRNFYYSNDLGFLRSVEVKV